MIDVKEAKEANEATAQVRKELREGWGGKAEPLFRVGGPYESESFRAFRDPAEMVTISANRFERLIRQNEDLQHRLTSCENLLNAISSFVDQEAMRYAQKGKELPSWEDAFKVGEIIHWTEPASIRYVRLDALQTAKAAQEIKEEEGANNGESTD